MRGTEAKTGAAEKGRFLQPHLWFAPASSQSDVQLALGRSPKRPSAGPEAQSEFVRTDEGRRGRGVKKKKKGASPAGVVPPAMGGQRLSTSGIPRAHRAT